MEAIKENKWMPVFTVIESTKRRFAVHPDHKGPIPQEQSKDNEDYELSWYCVDPK